MSHNIWRQKATKISNGFGEKFVHVEFLLPEDIAKDVTKVAFELDMNRSRYLCCLCIAAVNEYKKEKELIVPERLKDGKRR